MNRTRRKGKFGPWTIPNRDPALCLLLSLSVNNIRFKRNIKKTFYQRVSLAIHYVLIQKKIHIKFEFNKLLVRNTPGEDRKVQWGVPASMNYPNFCKSGVPKGVLRELLQYPKFHRDCRSPECVDCIVNRQAYNQSISSFF